MKRLIFVLAIAILLAGSAVGIMSGPSYAQGYGGYNYPPPPPNPYASPWVGPSTPWVYYNGDWFLNGILYYFFGNNYGWAPYYAYAPTYIVRPNDWYAPRWNAWYQQNPQYYQTFTQRYPYWRNHQYTRHYDRNFYEQHHRGQGGGWHQGYQGARPAGPTGPGGHTPGATAPGVRTPRTTEPAVRTPRTTEPAVRTPGPAGPGGHTPGTAAPAVRTPVGPGPAGHAPGAAGPAMHTPGPAPQAPKATGAVGPKPAKTPPAEERRDR